MNGFVLSITSKNLSRQKDFRSLVGIPRLRWNTPLLNGAEVENAVRAVEEIGLLAHSDRPKNWDSLIALSAITRDFDTTARILDAGAETYSVLLDWLDEFGYRKLHGINIAFPEWFVHGSAVYCRGDIESTSYPDKHFEVITCMSVIEHGVHLGQFFGEVGRILKDEGLLVLSTDYWDNGVDTGDKSIYGVPIKVFCREEIKELISLARKSGLHLMDRPTLSCEEKVVYWKKMDLRFTFLSLVFKKRCSSCDELSGI